MVMLNECATHASHGSSGGAPPRHPAWLFPEAHPGRSRTGRACAAPPASAPWQKPAPLHATLAAPAEAHTSSSMGLQARGQNRSRLCSASCVSPMAAAGSAACHALDGSHSQVGLLAPHYQGKVYRESHQAKRDLERSHTLKRRMMAACMGATAKSISWPPTVKHRSTEPRDFIHTSLRGVFTTWKRAAYITICCFTRSGSVKSSSCAAKHGTEFSIASSGRWR